MSSNSSSSLPSQRSLFSCIDRGNVGTLVAKAASQGKPEADTREVPQFPGSAGGTSSTESASASANDPGLAKALILITEKLERMDSKLHSVAKREDLAHTKTEILTQTHAHVAEQLAPIRAEVDRVRARIEVM